MGRASYTDTQKTSDNRNSITVAPAQRDRGPAQALEQLMEVEHDSELPPQPTGFRGLSQQLTLEKQPLGTCIQAKLIINPPGDKYELEADQIAAQVVRQINLPNSGEKETDRVEQPQNTVDYGAVVRKPIASINPTGNGSAAPSGLEASIQQESGKGQPLNRRIREPMEQALGQDLGGVRIHSDGHADQMNRALGARAFTTGRDIFFRAGEFNPESRSGQELISHEVTHFLQQNQNLQSPTNTVQRMPTSGKASQIVQCTRSKNKISDEEYERDLEATNQIEQRTGTSQGVYGGTKAETTALFNKKTPFEIYSDKLGVKILEAAGEIRGMPSSNDEEKEMRTNKAKERNLQINYGGEDESKIGRHTLQVGIDIVASFNAMQKKDLAKKGVSRMYDYGKIAKRLDQVVEGSRNNSKRGEKKYFQTRVNGEALKNRRKKVVEALKKIVKGESDNLGPLEGITDLGKKWIYKFASIMLAEQSRTMNAIEIAGKDIKKTESVVIEALDNVTEYGFAQVFDQGPKKIMFVGAGKGGAKKIKEHYKSKGAPTGVKRKGSPSELEGDPKRPKSE